MHGFLIMFVFCSGAPGLLAPTRALFAGRAVMFVVGGGFWASLGLAFAGYLGISVGFYARD